MSNSLNVYVLPRYVESDGLEGGVAVVVDVLRASTTIITALEAGAKEVIPCQEIEEARRFAVQFPPDEVILGGERKGLPIEGFDLGNSPDEYTPYSVAEKTVVFTTTNGTRAIHHALPAARVLIGAFVNASAIFGQLIDARHIHIVCAGTDGEISQDDVLLAGMLVERIERQSGMPFQLNAQAITARENWLHAFAVPQSIGAEPLAPERLALELRRSLGGKNLVAVGLEDDILFASQIDRYHGVPVVDRATGHIRLA
ncbi:MAG: 2-phosphosulfolactate phosphatase [Planctomycetota bacterium]